MSSPAKLPITKKQILPRKSEIFGDLILGISKKFQRANKSQ
jgi:hypothetical protein